MIDVRKLLHIYDDIGQLITEVNEILDTSYTYTYDNAGNIIQKTSQKISSSSGGDLWEQYALVPPIGSNPITTTTYGYSTGAWGDMLTSFKGMAITYDAIGNPLSYYNGESYTFTWQGRLLKTATTGGATYSFTYNDSGVRTSKTVNGVTTRYYWNGTQLIGEETSGNVIIYLYD